MKRQALCNKATALRAAFAAVALASMNVKAAAYTWSTANSTDNLGQEKQVDSTDRILIYRGTVNINEGASLKVGGDSTGNCNFIGI